MNYLDLFHFTNLVVSALPMSLNLYFQLITQVYTKDLLIIFHYIPLFILSDPSGQKVQVGGMIVKKMKIKLLEWDTPIFGVKGKATTWHHE